MLNLINGQEKLPPKVPLKEIMLAFFGGSICILCLLLLTQWSHHVMIMAPFGATCVLLYAAPMSPLAQPRNIILGHFISAFIGLLFLKTIGASLISMSLAVGLAIACMQYFQCVHPPAGANPLVLLLTAHTTSYDWSFLFTPVLSGSILLVIITAFVYGIFSKRKWPLYWFALLKTSANDQTTSKEQK
ncbi:HPP family protein [Acinetobacter apis]|uniref:HPP family protein n=1 Tax=Acinetobacter apis TaxID=1229165 RepID=A0A217EFW5_9GAMM|nr:HPP family protein [Acinetobacter apis]SNQ29373.1 HPP family protein [Acinetobacter apis]